MVRCFHVSLRHMAPPPEPEYSRLIGLREVRPDFVTWEKGGGRFCRDAGRPLGRGVATCTGLSKSR